MKKSRTLKAIEGFSLLIFVSLVTIVMLQVFFRYVMKISVPWTEEFARVLFMWMVFIGVVIVEAENMQLKTTYFLERMPVKTQLIVNIIINVLSIVFVIVLFIGSILVTQQSWIYMLGSIPWMSSAVGYIPAIIGSPFIIWYLIKQIKDMIKSTHQAEKGVGM